MGDKVKTELEINSALKLTSSASLGPLNVEFLRQSVSILEPRQPVCLSEDATLEEGLSCLRRNRVGCVLVVDQRGRLTGIFSERDCILKVTCAQSEYGRHSLKSFMTPNPVTQPPDGSIAYALNLMSQGGFRHIPIVDQDHMPIGIISVKDVVDYLVRTYTDALLNFETG